MVTFGQMQETYVNNTCITALQLLSALRSAIKNIINMKKSFLFVFCSLSFCLSILAQTIGRQVVAAGGTTTATPMLSLSWTAGEAIVGNAGDGGLSIHQGFQQPETLITSIDEKPDLNKTLALRVYPNPTDGLLHLEGLNAPNAEWQICLFSALGQKLTVDVAVPLGKTGLSLNLSGLPAGQYFLRVQSELPESVGIVAFQKIN